MTTSIVWQGPQHAEAGALGGAQGPGLRAGRGLRVDVQPGDQPGVEVVREIDLYSGAELRDELLRVLRLHGPRLTLDLHEVTFMDSAGIEVLLATRRSARLESGWVRVARASPCVCRMLTLAGL